ncbi:MAG: MAPEG family protein, partial [Burkholderiales bacterium]
MGPGTMIVTPLYAALLGLWLLVLSLRVVQQRRAARVSLGDGGNTALQRAIRAQGNFVEYVPLALL